MRAKTVPKNKAYIFDFDETLVKTDAKVHILKDGKRSYSLTPSEYNFYHPKPGEEIDMSDFSDPRLIYSATKYKMWPVIRNVDMARKTGRSDSDIYILTARSPSAQVPIYNFLKREGIDIPLSYVLTIGNDNGDYYDIAAEKKEVLLKIANSYQEVIFFDDNEKNIKLANEIPGIKTRLIDSLKEI